MSEAEDKLGAILNNPQLMQQIMALAQSMNQQAAPKDAGPPPRPANPPTEMDLSLLRNFTGIARQSGIDRDQQTLLRALTPFLSRERVNKLERAMHAAKMAQLASTFLNSGGLKILTGR